MEENNTPNDATVESGSFSMNKFIDACKAKWQWFALSATIFTCLGVWVAITQEPEYKRTMSVLIKDPQNAPNISEMIGSISAFGFSGAKKNVYNELLTITSPDVMTDVVRRLHLETAYTLKGFPHGTTLYGTTLPFSVEFLDLSADKGASLEIDVRPDGEMTFHDFSIFDKEGSEIFEKEVKIPAGATIVRTPIGKIQIVPNQRFAGKPFEKDETIEVRHSIFRKTVQSYCKAVSGDLADRDAEIIDLSINDVSEERADDILNTMLDVYTAKYINDKNQLSAATANFIGERLAVIEKELGQVENNIMEYKSKTLVPDLEEAARLNMLSTHEIDTQILEANTMLGMAQYVADYVKNPANAHSVIPVNTGGVSQQLEAQIDNYNTILLARNNVAESTSPSTRLSRIMTHSSRDSVNQSNAEWLPT